MPCAFGFVWRRGYDSRPYGVPVPAASTPATGDDTLHGGTTDAPGTQTADQRAEVRSAGGADAAEVPRRAGSGGERSAPSGTIRKGGAGFQSPRTTRVKPSV